MVNNSYCRKYVSRLSITSYILGLPKRISKVWFMSKFSFEQRALLIMNSVEAKRIQDTGAHLLTPCGISYHDHTLFEMNRFVRYDHCTLRLLFSFAFPLLHSFMAFDTKTWWPCWDV